jgi:hypothetical protein
MILSEKTIEVLKNFYSINPSLVVKEGNVLTTISTAKTIVAKATVSDMFVKRFAMYNLGQLISTVTAAEKADITFKDNCLLVKDNESEETTLVYADESGIKVPPEKPINLPTIEASCNITAEQLRSVQKRLGILNLPEIAVVGDGDKVYLRAIDTKNPSSNMFSIVIGSTDKNFRAVFKPENLKVIPDNYEVSICSKGISHFKGQDIEYWIAVEAHSTYN